MNAEPKNIVAQLKFWQALHAQKQHDQAIGAFNAVLENNLDRADAYHGLGVAYFHQGTRDEAKQAFGKSVRKPLVDGRRDLALKVKEEYDALLGAPQTGSAVQQQASSRK